MLSRYTSPTDDQFDVGDITDDLVGDIVEDLDRAYEDGKEDLGRMVIGFLQQLAEEEVDIDEAIERTIDLIEYELAAKLVDEDGIDLADLEELN